ncbi:MAG: S-methyl-5'-thioinosine phosphorylase [Gammaproteobacteria bacterium]
MSRIAVIGGTGLVAIPGLVILDNIKVKTRWGKPSADITLGKLNNNEVLFLPRHGNPHVIPPHKVNYRANIEALHEQGVTQIIAVNAVGGITSEMTPCRIVVPDQLIDYTHGRIDTFHEEELSEVVHIDFTAPYSETVRQLLIKAAEKCKLDIYAGGTYGVTQGPRLETAAEIARMERDGCDIVGMTSMPEASLAREKEIEYGCVSLVVNWAAGKTDEIITMEIIEQNLKQGMDNILKLLGTVLSQQ